jgi:hypothetical protein
MKPASATAAYGLAHRLQICELCEAATAACAFVKVNRSQDAKDRAVNVPE